MPYATFLRGSKHPPNLNPGGSGVESTARNCRKQLKKRVADRKHGFESRWGHHGDVVVIFAPKFSSPGGRDVNNYFQCPSLSNVSNACWTSCCVILI